MKSSARSVEVSQPSAPSHDVYGEFRTLNVAGVETQLRWIPAGTFEMGASEPDLMSSPDEKPAHRVHISEGFWLFETPATQQLWTSVMGDNPSEFQSPSRPVESISFHQVMEFLDLINQANQGVVFNLPSEAQWEYACRAGSEQATWAGELQLAGINNVPVLDPIAWYAGNASFGYKIKPGVDSSQWEQCELTGDKAGTHAVGLKQPNPWGLRDMLGNVWEWCHDGMRLYQQQEELCIDPQGPTDQDCRCARGGSWRDSPAKLRASYRDQIELDYKNNFVGFRCTVDFTVEKPS